MKQDDVDQAKPVRIDGVNTGNGCACDFMSATVQVSRYRHYLSIENIIYIARNDEISTSQHRVCNLPDSGMTVLSEKSR